MKLSHYSRDVITSLHPIEPRGLPNGKPYGLWVSVDGEYDWKWWCEAEEFFLERLAHRHEITLQGNHNILILSDIYDFTNEYSYLPDCYKDQPSMRNWNIDWRKVFEKYDGIIIAPYCWTSRNKYMWYYGWDCASGCIWNIHAIKEIKLKEQK